MRISCKIGRLKCVLLLGVALVLALVLVLFRERFLIITSSNDRMYYIYINELNAGRLHPGDKGWEVMRRNRLSTVYFILNHARLKDLAVEKNAKILVDDLGENVIPLLIQGLDSDQEQVVLFCIEAISSMKGDKTIAVAHLMEICSNNPNQRLVLAAEDGLVQIGQPAVPFVMSWFKDEARLDDPDVFKRMGPENVLCSMGQNAMSVVPELISICRDDNNILADRASGLVASILQSKNKPELFIQDADQLFAESKPYCTIAALRLYQVAINMYTSDPDGGLDKENVILRMLIRIAQSTNNSDSRVKTTAIRMWEFLNERVLKTLPFYQDLKNKIPEVS